MVDGWAGIANVPPTPTARLEMAELAWEKVCTVPVGIAVRIGDGFRLTYTWMASRDHVSIDLNEYLFEMRAMSISCVSGAMGAWTIFSS